MVFRRPIVISGQFLSEADNSDATPILGTIVYGSGLGDVSENYDNNYTANVYLTTAPSGLIYVLESGRYKLADNGASRIEATQALASGNLALLLVAPAYASGIEAQRIAVSALASGNTALLTSLSGIQLSSAAVTTSSAAYASGAAAQTTASTILAANTVAISSGTYAYGSGVAANIDAVTALASGNAALAAIINSPFVSAEELVGLILGLS
jgi:hypothetical protein